MKVSVFTRRPQRAQLNNCINLFEKKQQKSTVSVRTIYNISISNERTRRAEIEKEAARTRLGAGRVLRNCYDSLRVLRMMHSNARISVLVHTVAPKIAHTLFRA